MFPDLKTKPLFESDGSKHPRWIFDEGEIMEDPNDLFLEIFDPSEKIDQLSKPLGVKLECQSIHCKISAVEVHFDRAALDGRQGRGRLVNLQAGRRHIDFGTVWKKNNGGPELSVRSNPAWDLLFKGLRKSNSIPL